MGNDLKALRDRFARPREVEAATDPRPVNRNPLCLDCGGTGRVLDVVDASSECEACHGTGIWLRNGRAWGIGNKDCSCGHPYRRHQFEGGLIATCSDPLAKDCSCVIVKPSPDLPDFLECAVCEHPRGRHSLDGLTCYGVKTVVNGRCICPGFTVQAPAPAEAPLPEATSAGIPLPDGVCPVCRGSGWEAVNVSCAACAGSGDLFAE